MSATVDCSLFSKYFSILINGQQEGAPIIRVDGKMFDVDEYYFEDISRLSEVTRNFSSQPFTKKSMFLFLFLEKKIEEIFQINGELFMNIFQGIFLE